MKKSKIRTVFIALMIVFACMTAACAEIIPPYEPGQQIGYPAVVLCEKLTLRENPGSNSRALKTLHYGDLPIVVGADLPAGPQMEQGFVYCTLGDSIDSLCGWINADYVFINPAWYVTERSTAVYAWNSTAAPKVGLLATGTRLPILKEESRWYLVSLRGAVGWIRK